MLGGSMLRPQFAPLEIYETEYQALASLGAEVRVGRSGSEPKYASELPLLEVREIDEVVCVGFRSENPACDQPMEVGSQFRRLVASSCKRKVVLDLSKLRTTSTALNCAFAMLAKALGSVKGRLAAWGVRPHLVEHFRLIEL